MSIDGRYQLETPESVEVTFDLAGIGSRACAMLVDLLFLALAAVVVILLLAFVGSIEAMMERARGATEAALAWGTALCIAILVVALIAYHAIFELAMAGQTPGKRLMGLRVIREDATPASGTDILVRNLLRFVDSLPPPTYGVGVVAMFLSRRHQRLGDLAAGTIVVKEGRLGDAASWHEAGRTPADDALSLAPSCELTPEERRLVTSYLQRRGELLPAARAQLAARLAGPLHARHGGTLDDPDAYLERLAQGRQHEP